MKNQVHEENYCFPKNCLFSTIILADVCPQFAGGGGGPHNFHSLAGHECMYVVHLSAVVCVGNLRMGVGSRHVTQ